MLSKSVSDTSAQEGCLEQWPEIHNVLTDCHDRVYLPSQDGGVDTKEYLHR